MLATILKKKLQLKYHFILFSKKLFYAKCAIHNFQPINQSKKNIFLYPKILQSRL